MGGCLLGVARRRGQGGVPQGLGLVGLAAGFALLLAANPAQQGDELTGWRGVLLCSLCFALVHGAGRLRLASGMASVARYLGDATYGVYLLHPVVFFGLVFVVLPRLGISSPGPSTWAMPSRLALAALVVVAAFALALFSEKYFEKPLRAVGKRRLKAA